MNDQELFRIFINDLLNGESTLASNPNYRLESSFGMLQLVDNKLGVVATAKVTEQPIQVMVKRHSDCWDELRPILSAHNLFPNLRELQKPLVPFTAVPYAENLHVYELPASEIWRSWRRGKLTTVKLLIDGQWQDIQEITCSAGVVCFIFDSGINDVQVTGGTQLSWLGDASLA